MAKEFKLSYTASEIDAKLGKIDSLASKDEIPSKISELTNDSEFATETYVNDKVSAVSILVGNTSVSEQISTAISNSVADWNQTDEAAVNYIKNKPEIDTTLTQEGKLADAKAVGDVLALKADQTSLDKVSALVGNAAVSEQINNAIAEADFVSTPSTAQVGQLLSVKAVDENGKPTEWEAADMSESVTDDYIKELIDASGAVKSVNGVAPDESGNIDIGGLNVIDDGNGNVFVTSYGSVSISDDGEGNVTII